MSLPHVAAAPPDRPRPLLPVPEADPSGLRAAPGRERRELPAAPVLGGQVTERGSRSDPARARGEARPPWPGRPRGGAEGRGVPGSVSCPPAVPGLPGLGRARQRRAEVACAPRPPSPPAVPPLRSRSRGSEASPCVQHQGLRGVRLHWGDYVRLL